MIKKLVLEFDKKFKDADRFELVDTDLNPLKDSNGNDLVFSLKTGTVESYRHIKDGGAGYEIFKVRGDKNATDLFEFLSDNITGRSEVEFSMIRTGVEGDKGQNFISTSHRERSDISFGWLYEYQIKYNYHFREFIHSHPNSRKPSNSDKATKAYIRKEQNSQRLAIPKTLIYYVPKNRYINY